MFPVEIATKGTDPSAGQIMVGMPQSPSNCDKICTGDDVPVCGTNHQTYKNSCELENAQCQNPAIGYAYSGKCTGDIALSLKKFILKKKVFSHFVNKIIDLKVLKKK